MAYKFRIHARKSFLSEFFISLFVVLGAFFLNSGTMESFVIGVNHRTAPLSVRGAVAFAPHQGAACLVQLRERFPAQGFVLLSTCNRTELYGTLSAEGGDPYACLQELISGRNLDWEELEPCLYVHTGADALLHLFRVACALDSMLVGEDQILGQVKSAFELAREHKSSNLFLDVSFRHAVTAGKRVKAETGISRNSLSLGTLAVKAAEQVLGDLRGMSALVVGSGKMGSLAVRNLLQAGVSPLYVTVRTKHGKQGGLRDEFAGVEAVDYDQRLQLIDQCSIVVSATQCPFFTMKCDAVENSLASVKPRVFLDLAVPRDMDPLIGDLPGCSYFDLDQLQAIAAENHDLRKAEVLQAEVILQEEYTEFKRWWMHRKAIPTLRRMRVNLRKRWKVAESNMLKHLAVEHKTGALGQDEWAHAYSKLAENTLDVVFYRLREHCTPDELDVLYRGMERAFRKW